MKKATRRRGPIEIYMDPKDAASTKEVMTDWLRLHFPKVMIPSGAKTEEVAQIVREQQPHLFPDPNSNKRAPDLKPDISSLPDLKPDISSLGTGSSKSPAPHVHFEKKLSDAPYPLGLYPELPSNPEMSTRVARIERKAERAGKRLAPFELSKDPKKKKASSNGPGLFTNKVKKNVPSQTAPTTADKLGSKSEELLVSLSVPIKDEKDLGGISKDYEALPVLGTPEARTELKVNTMVTTADLIDLSPLDCFEVGNLVIGTDIPPIQVSGKKKSGVDVFLEDMNRHKKMCMLEQTVADLQEQVDTDKESFKKMFQDEKEKHEHIREEQNKLVSSLEEKVRGLEIQVACLSTNLDKVHEEISTHEEIMIKLMRADETQEDRSEEDEEDEEDENELDDRISSGYF